MTATSASASTSTMSGVAEWTAFVSAQLANLPDDAPITCVDCHS